MPSHHIFKLPFQVRDYECDTGGGVNNAVYLHYFEHARFQFMREHLGWDVKLLDENKIGFVLISLNLEFRRSLMPNDNFIVESSMTRISPRRFLFNQEIHITPRHAETGIGTRKPAVTAKVICTAINTQTGRSETPPFLESLLTNFPITPVEATA